MSQSTRSLANFCFTLLLLAGPIAVLLSRVIVRLLPIEFMVGIVTDYPINRIKEERIRIVTEGGDYAYFLVVASVAVLLFFATFFVARNTRLSSFQFSVDYYPRYQSTQLWVAATVLAIHLATLHRWRTESYGERFLDGFGIGPVVLALIAGFIIPRLNKPASWSLQIASLTSARTAVNVFSSLILLPPLLIFGRQVAWNREYIIIYNEYAAASANLKPLSNFASTYTSLAGFLIKPVIQRVSTEVVIPALTIFHIVLSSILLIVIVLLSKRLLGCSLTFAFAICAVLLSPRRNAELASSFFPSTSNPARYLLPLVVLLILTSVFGSTSISFWQSVILGIAIGVALANNAEIGIPILVASTVSLSLRAIRNNSIVRLLLLPALVGMGTFLGIMWLLGSGNLFEAIRTWSIFLASRSAGGFIGAVPIWGVHQIAIAVHWTSLIIGIMLVLKDRKAPDSKVNQSASMNVTLGIFGLLTFPFFLSQNGPVFIGGTLWLPFVLSVIGLITTVRSLHDSSLNCEGRTEISVARPACDSLLLGLILLVICNLSFLTDPQLSIGIHFQSSYPSWNSTKFLEDPLTESLQAAIANEDDEKLAYFGEYGNLYNLLLGIHTVYGVHDPMIAYSSRRTSEFTCKPIAELSPNVVFASKKYLPSNFLLPDTVEGPCPGLRRDLRFNSTTLIRYFYD